MAFTDIYQYFLAPIIGFLFGSIPFAWIIVKIRTGKDVRELGSGSVSTRNTVRTAGWGWAVLTGTLDITKGFLSVFLMRFVFFPNHPQIDLLVALSGMAAFAGHCWMPWMGFRGGKGFAVLTGALIVINPWGILVWWGSLPLYLITIRYSGISGISSTASVALTLTIFYLTEVTFWHSWALLVFGWGCTLLIILRMIPDFRAIKRGEIKRWKGMEISQWMK
ncbi:MAG: hypothetical protein GF308_14605 [Candidatus Heimdallarchaeota archaeon]|nr:hypothetical protein [Candidatus Heimdallarchaeota archaeon]